MSGLLAYRSGDLARRQSGGLLTFAGRRELSGGSFENEVAILASSPYGWVEGLGFGGGLGFEGLYPKS